MPRPLWHTTRIVRRPGVEVRGGRYDHTPRRSPGLLLFDNGSDTIDGGPGDGNLDGQNGNDTLTDHNGTDTMSGGVGGDTINVQDGTGGDTANGGLGNDTCTVDAGDTTSSC